MTNFEQEFRRLGLKITPRRLDLFRVLNKLKDDHPTFNDLYAEMTALSPTISRSTLHNNLKDLENNNLIISFNHNNETHYELNQSLHVNVVKAENRIKDIHDQDIELHLEQVRDLIKNKYGKVKKFTVLVELEEK